MPTEERPEAAPCAPCEEEVRAGKHSLDELAKGLASGSITRGQLLKFGGAALLGGALSASFPGVALAQHNNRRKGKQPPGIFDPGYDPTGTGDESFPITSLPPKDLSSSRAIVNTKYLPPVGAQGTERQPGYPGSCAAWATTYDLATFAAAKAGDYSPDQLSLQASPAYIYIKVLQQNNVPKYDCQSSGFLPYFDMLKPVSEGGQGGTPNMQQAPYVPDCTELWNIYGSQNLQPDSRFSISKYVKISSTDPDQVKQKIAHGTALAYATHLYTDFESYNGSPVPYVGNGILQKNPITKQYVGHCMMIIGYNDDVNGSGTGAFLIQNSFGTVWGGSIDPEGGPRGYVWMAYDTFAKLVQGHGHAWYLEV